MTTKYMLKTKIHAKMKLRWPHIRDTEAGGQQGLVVTLHRLSVGPGRRNVCVCVVGITMMCVLSFTEHYSWVLQALQLKQPLAANKKCLSGQQHKSHGWYLVRCSGINGKGKELNVKHSFYSKKWRTPCAHNRIQGRYLHNVKVEHPSLCTHCPMVRCVI